MNKFTEFTDLTGEKILVNIEKIVYLGPLPPRKDVCTLYVEGIGRSISVQGHYGHLKRKIKDFYEND